MSSQKFLNEHLFTDVSTDVLCALISFILTYDNLVFDDHNYLQTSGTAMDTKMATSKCKLPLRGRITCRHCRLPKLPDFLCLSNTTSRRLMKRANNNKVAPCFANHSMASIEKTFIDNSPLTSLSYVLFIDDIFVIWTHESEELEQFATRANSTHPSIKFTT